MKEHNLMRTDENASAPVLGRELYRFEGFELDLLAAELRRNGCALPLTTKSLGVLAYLIRHRDRVVSRSELIAALWPGVRVSTGSLSQAIWEIRHAFGKDPRSVRIIKTLRGRGYRFSAQLERLRVPSEFEMHARARFEVTNTNTLETNDFASVLERWSGMTLPESLRERMRGVSKENMLTFVEFFLACTTISVTAIVPTWPARSG
jgi:DNA-binding winged helix-turn-helix (wHTH) protein